MNPIIPNESELRLRWAELQELEQTVVELIATALKLAPLERRDNLAVIGSFRMRIAAMKRVELARASSLNTA
jgi:DNA polymerase sigma